MPSYFGHGIRGGPLFLPDRNTYSLTMKNIAFFILYIFSAIHVYAGNELEVARRVANHIIEIHNHRLEIVADGTCRIASYYQEWRYVNGVLALSMLDLYRITGNESYLTFVKDNYAFFFNKDNQMLMRKEYERGIRNTGYYRFFRMGSLDDCGAMGAALVELNIISPRSEYTSYIKRIFNYILFEESRLSDGTFCRGEKGNLTVWLDDLYMSLSFLTHYGAVFHDTECFDCAALQVIRFDSLLASPSTGLYYHCYYRETDQQGVAHWGRANGWGLLAQSLLLSVIPADHPQRDRLLEIFRKTVRSISRYQDKDGMWHQLLDKTDSYPETSCTAMFIYSIAKGINEGWIEKEYISLVERAWNTLASSYITVKGELKNVCMGTGSSYDLPFYYDRPIPLNDAHGLGAVIQASIEVHKLFNRK